jgi:hypothetical protein
LNHHDSDLMRTSRLIPMLSLSLALAASACSQDAPVAGAEEGGMGAGRPDTAGSIEADPQEVLGVTGHPEQQDTGAAGAPSMTGALRDSLHDGEAIPGVDQPQPARPGF